MVGHDLATDDLGSEDVARRAGVGEASGTGQRLVAVGRGGSSSFSSSVALRIGLRIALPDGIALAETHPRPGHDTGGRFDVEVGSQVAIVRRPSALLHEGVVGIGIPNGKGSRIGLLGNGAVDLNAVAGLSGRINMGVVLLAEKLGVTIEVEGLVEVDRTARIGRSVVVTNGLKSIVGQSTAHGIGSIGSDKGVVHGSHSSRQDAFAGSTDLGALDGVTPILVVEEVHGNLASFDVDGVRDETSGAAAEGVGGAVEFQALGRDVGQFEATAGRNGVDVGGIGNRGLVVLLNTRVAGGVVQLVRALTFVGLVAIEQIVLRESWGTRRRTREARGLAGGLVGNVGLQRGADVDAGAATGGAGVVGVTQNALDLKQAPVAGQVLSVEHTSGQAASL